MVPPATTPTGPVSHLPGGPPGPGLWCGARQLAGFSPEAPRVRTSRSRPGRRPGKAGAGAPGRPARRAAERVRRHRPPPGEHRPATGSKNLPGSPKSASTICDPPGRADVSSTLVNGPEIIVVTPRSPLTQPFAGRDGVRVGELGARACRRRPKRPLSTLKAHSCARKALSLAWVWWLPISALGPTRAQYLAFFHDTGAGGGAGRRGTLLPVREVLTPGTARSPPFEHPAIPDPEEEDTTMAAIVHPSCIAAGGPATV